MRTRSLAGFARAWTHEHLLVQVVMQITPYLGAQEFWTEARLVRRRVIELAWQARGPDRAEVRLPGVPT